MAFTPWIGTTAPGVILMRARILHVVDSKHALGVFRALMERNASTFYETLDPTCQRPEMSTTYFHTHIFGVA